MIWWINFMFLVECCEGEWVDIDDEKNEKEIFVTSATVKMISHLSRKIANMGIRNFNWCELSWTYEKNIEMKQRREMKYGKHFKRLNQTN